MSYHRFLRSLILSVLSFVAWPVTSIVSAIRAIDWPSPSLDASASLELDSLARVHTDMPAKRSRFRSFVERALTHDNFSAGHFDPGRMPA